MSRRGTDTTQADKDAILAQLFAFYESSEYKCTPAKPSDAELIRDRLRRHLKTKEWLSSLRVLCEYYNIPDLTHRSGLKQVCNDFDAIWQRLSTAFERNQGDKAIMTSLGVIYTAICADTLLCDKAFQAGLLDQFVVLLVDESCQNMALHGLLASISNSSEEVRVKVAKKSPILLDILDEHSGDESTADIAISIILSAIQPILQGRDDPDPILLDAICLPRILRAILREMRKRTISSSNVGMWFGLVGSIGSHCPSDLKGCPSALELLVGSFSSKDMRLRYQSIGALGGYCAAFAEQDDHSISPRKLLERVRTGFPDHLNAILDRYGRQQCESYQIFTCQVIYGEAMLRNAQDRDFYALGKVLSRLMQNTRAHMWDGEFRADHGIPMDSGLPYVRWVDAIPHCAEALRSKGDIALANIVMLEYLVMNKQITLAHDLAEKAMKRSPEVAYFHFIAVHTADNARTRLLLAKKGLRAKHTTPFLQFALLEYAIEQAIDLQMQLLSSETLICDSEKRWSLAVALLNDALADAETYITTAPPDSSLMKTILNIYIVWTLVVKGLDVFVEKLESYDLLQRAQSAEEFSTLCGSTVRNTDMRFVRQAIISMYPSAVKEWRDLVSRFDSETDRFQPTKEDVDSGLLERLEGLSFSNTDPAAKRKWGRPGICISTASLYRCSACGITSAMLRKCSRCGKAWYCGKDCQRSHWSAHKAECR
ncbi:hypothetical protein OE88DRAFT_1673573 [Heliocybe sulcata]|uniref:MYND-type domain-containing protein n=1 Tax=Heliocybe sulcata TaxID=5364 RepID=A0A5C3NFY7_9AGAM|nr:hypothetical protein OE88DRAFT_1673573 [Heliocybe sulcata]